MTASLFVHIWTRDTEDKNTMLDCCATGSLFKYLKRTVQKGLVSYWGICHLFWSLFTVVMRCLQEEKGFYIILHRWWCDHTKITIRSVYKLSAKIKVGKLHVSNWKDDYTIVRRLNWLDPIFRWIEGRPV